MNLRSWLRREPQPARVVADTRTIQVPSGPRKWAELEETIISIGATKVEAIDREGNLLRVVNLETEESTSGAAMGKPSGALSEMAQMAQIIAEAGDRAALRHADAYRLAFEENTKLVGLLADRLGSLETAWMRTLDQLAEARQSQQEQGSGEVQALIAAALAGQAQGAAAPPKPPIPIEKGKKTP